MEVLVPDNNIEKLFYQMVKPLFEKMKSNSIQNQTLTHLRDTLLPKLMSGAVAVE
jgi:type I restriction enzyme S subunit